MFKIKKLGKSRFPSPIRSSYFISDTKRLLFNSTMEGYEAREPEKIYDQSIELAGPRETIYFDPETSRAAIVTCGGLCPGINDVIRAIVMGLHYRYGVRDITGLRYGFQGFIPEYGRENIALNPELVKDIHTLGGSILASSRGHQDVGRIVDFLVTQHIAMLFCIGGDGTMRASNLITDEIERRKLDISVIGIPKTIDNDLNLIDKSFGFNTAISEVVRVIQCAHIEAKGAPLGIGLIKIMGRESGHIAANATLAQNDVNITLIPEVPIELEGEEGLLRKIERRLMERGHIVILVAEGAGQDLFIRDEDLEMDASGNVKLQDIGTFLKARIGDYFRKKAIDVSLKYIDPSYIIRSVPANASDSLYCELLGQYAVHAAMSGRTGMVVGLFKNEFVHLPLKVTSSRRKVDVTGNVWMRVLESTGQSNI